MHFTLICPLLRIQFLRFSLLHLYSCIQYSVQHYTMGRNPLTNPLRYATPQLRTGPPVTYAAAERTLVSYDYGMDKNPRHLCFFSVFLANGIQSSLVPVLQVVSWPANSPKTRMFQFWSLKLVVTIPKFSNQKSRFYSQNCFTHLMTGITTQSSNRSSPTDSSIGPVERSSEARLQ